MHCAIVDVKKFTNILYQYDIKIMKILNISSCFKLLQFSTKVFILQLSLW